MDSFPFMTTETSKAAGPVCPACQVQDGKAFFVSAHNGIITVSYRCSCGHRWTDHRDDPDRAVFAVMRASR
jgi:Zn ribbon nucleic-acid-binding protein